MSLQDAYTPKHQSFSCVSYSHLSINILYQVLLVPSKSHELTCLMASGCTGRKSEMTAKRWEHALMYNLQFCRTWDIFSAWDGVQHWGPWVSESSRQGRNSWWSSLVAPQPWFNSIALGWHGNDSGHSPSRSYYLYDSAKPTPVSRHELAHTQPPAQAPLSFDPVQQA